MLKIARVEKNSVGARIRLKKGDRLYGFDNEEAPDVLDYEYFDGQENFTLVVKRKQGLIERIKVRKSADETLGIIFDDEHYVMSKACNNKCVFCFVDQLPKGMRKTLYFKDDDWRLSFIAGNYVTFTNITEKEIKRICSRKFSPLYVSVHTTDDTLRRKMLQNPSAIEIMPLLKKLTDENIVMHAQIVVCPGINDKKVLEKSLKDLYELFPGIASVALVPVGLTGFRENLPNVTSVNKQSAHDIIKIAEKFSSTSKKRNGKSFVFCADELYIKAEKEIPPYEFYEDFCQLENGVGLVAKFMKELSEGLKLAEKCLEGSFTILTGEAFFDYLSKFFDFAKEKFPKLKCNVIKITNYFFGTSVDVSGLVTAIDIIEQIKNYEINETVLIPRSMIKEFDKVFLDDVSINDLSKQIKRKVKVVKVDGSELIREMFTGEEL